MTTTATQYFESDDRSKRTMARFAQESRDRMEFGDEASDDIVNVSMFYLDLPGPTLRAKTATLDSRAVAATLADPPSVFGMRFKDTVCAQRSFAALYDALDGASSLFDEKAPFDHVLVPLHGGRHWSLLVVDCRSETATHYDSLAPCHTLKAQEALRAMINGGLLPRRVYRPVSGLGTALQQDSKSCGYVTIASMALYSPHRLLRTLFPHPKEVREDSIGLIEEVSVRLLAAEQAMIQREAERDRAARVFRRCVNGVSGCKCCNGKRRRRK